MADGTFAVLTLLLGLAQTGDCPETGCLSTHDSPPSLGVSFGEVLERRADSQKELYVTWAPGTSFGRYDTRAGLSVAEHGETWFGYGVTIDAMAPDAPFFIQLHAMPGVYLPNGGFDLGGPVAFRSGVEVGFQNRDGWRFGLSYDHRSNAGIHEENPGIETLQMRVTKTLD